MFLKTGYKSFSDAIYNPTIIAPDIKESLKSETLGYS